VFLAGENPGDYYSVLIVVTGIALLIKYVQITTVYSLFKVFDIEERIALNNLSLKIQFWT
jgi:hypothetical protein